MISSKEIARKANAKGVRQQQIEKDYIISWILWGIYNNDRLKDTLIFKGGTCIRKIHIEDYRYSEDMDFTLNPENEKEITNEGIYSAFETVFNDVKEVANIDLSIHDDSKEVHESGGIKFFITFVGPLGGRGDHVKTDISRGDKLEFDIERLPVLNQYSDLADEQDVAVQCYGLKEIVIEKMVALMGRTIPRDLYDFEYLTNTEGIELQDIFSGYQAKAKHKGHNPDEFVEKITAKEKILEKAWEENLRYQIKDLRKFNDMWRDLKKQFRIFERCK